MRHRVFEDGEDFEIDKYDIQVSTLIYINNYYTVISTA